MSMLAPLYAIGLLAVSLPVLFHLIRRQPRGEFQFSSLMFLSPSPPRVTRRSRLDHLLLLLLRGLVLSLLAFAFARPFLRGEEPPAPTGAATRMAIVVDTSASMRRGDLWPKAVAAVDKLMSERQPQDQVAIFTCDDTLRPIVTFENMSLVTPGERRAMVAKRLADMQPTWASTRLGQGLIEAVEAVSSAAESLDPESGVKRRVALVSDMQEGSRLNALADYPWPENVELELRSVAPAQESNAGLHYVADTHNSDAAATVNYVRVRVSNEAESTSDEFELTWLDEHEKPIGSSTRTYVPAGESRIVHVPRSEAAKKARRLQLTGDSFDFDNTLYLAAADDSPISVVYLGNDAADDAKAPRFYLERALAEGLARPVSLVAPQANQPLPLELPESTPLVVVATKVAGDEATKLRKYAEIGGSVLVVLRESQEIGDLPKLVGATALDVEEARVDGFALLGKIDFDHPLFAPMAGPHFNDFTQIHFWKYRWLKRDQLGAGRVLAQFENGDPAFVEWTIGKGRVLILTSGWQPADSQLSRSWKFVLLCASWMQGNKSESVDRTQFAVNEPVPLAAAGGKSDLPTVTKPDRSEAKLAPGATAFVATDTPGIYAIVRAKDTRPQEIAVNLDPLESRTSPLAAESLEQFGCRLVKPTAVAEARRAQQHLRDTQLESRQKYWQWLIAAALGLIAVETWLAARTMRSEGAAPVILAGRAGDGA